MKVTLPSRSLALFYLLSITFVSIMITVSLIYNVYSFETDLTNWIIVAYGMNIFLSSFLGIFIKYTFFCSDKEQLFKNSRYTIRPPF